MPYIAKVQVLTGLEWPCSSVVDPTLGGSTITSYIIPTISIFSMYSTYIVSISNLLLPRNKTPKPVKTSS